MAKTNRKNLFSKLTSRVPGVVFQFKMTADGHTSVPFANEKLQEVIGLEPADIRYDATPFFDIVHSNDLNGLLNSIQYSRENMLDWMYEFRICPSQGEARWLRGVARPELLHDKSVLWHGYIMNVTEKKSREEENYETHLKYHGYFRNATEGLFVVDRTGNFLEANPAALNMTGYALKEILTMNVSGLLGPSFAEEDSRALMRTFEWGSIDEEILLQKKNGDLFWVRFVTSAIDHNTALAFCHDISQRKKQEEMLQSQFFFQELMLAVSSAFVNSTADSFNAVVDSMLKKVGLFFEADRSYVFLFSENYSRMYNTHEWCAENIGSEKDNLQDINPEEIHWWWSQLKNKSIINIADVVTHQELTSFEKEMLYSQGIKSLLCIPLINNGVLIGLLGLDSVTKYRVWSKETIARLNIITEIVSGAFSKYLAENALRLSENKYRLLAENARDMIFRMSLLPEKKYEYVSPSSVNLNGYTPEEYYKDNTIEQKIIHPDDLRKDFLFSTNPESYEKPQVMRMTCKDGRQIWCEKTIVPIFDDEGLLIALEGIARDITGQKEFENRLKEVNNELLEKKDALEALNLSLEDKVNKEVEKNRGLDHLMALQARQAAMGEMIGNIAHQWRQPLNVLSLAIYDLADAFEFEELDKKYMDNTVEEMNRIIQEMSKTIDDFRNFFKPESEKKYFDVATVINNALIFMKPYTDKLEVKISRDIPAKIHVYGYSAQLEQVVINILKNAVDALKEADEKELHLKLSADLKEGEGRCHIEVENTGLQIPEFIFPRLFDPYFTTKPEGQGLGLGLYIAKIIVEKNMEGKLFCENTSRGVKFVVQLKCYRY